LAELANLIEGRAGNGGKVVFEGEVSVENNTKVANMSGRVESGIAKGQGSRRNF